MPVGQDLGGVFVGPPFHGQPYRAAGMAEQRDSCGCCVGGEGPPGVAVDEMGAFLGQQGCLLIGG
jgi:hypothetical protein